MARLGYLPDPRKLLHEEPDWDAIDVLGSDAVVEQASTRHLIVDVLNQGGLGSCVANAIFQAIRASHVRQGVVSPKLGSRLFGYFFSRAFHHMTGHDSGTHLRTFCQALNKFGFPAEESWPYDDGGESFKRVPSSKVVRLAYDQKSPTSYRRIYESGYERIEAIKRAIKAEHLVCFGTDVSEAFAQGNDGVTPIDPPTSEPIAGGHAMCVTDFRGDDFGILNSWGAGYGQDGYVRFTADYLAWNQTRDLWVIEHSPSFSE